MNLAIASYSFHGMLEEKTMDVFGYLESCRWRYGLRTADIWSGFLPTLDKDFLAKVKAALEERELELVNLCVDGPHLWEDDPEVRKRHRLQALAWLDAAEFLGARTVRIDAGVRADSFTPEQLDYIVTTYREYARRAHDGGYRVGPENHWGAEVVPENMKAICESVNHPGFGVLIHFQRKGEAEFAKWAMHTHCSWDALHGDFSKYVAMLRSAGYAGAWSAEHHTGTHEHERVAVQLSRLRAVLRGAS